MQKNEFHKFFSEIVESIKFEKENHQALICWPSILNTVVLKRSRDVSLTSVRVYFTISFVQLLG